MANGARVRHVRVLAQGDAMIRALSEHCATQEGWRIGTLDGPPEPDALIILDLDDPAEQLRHADRVRDGGFAGPVLMLGVQPDFGEAVSPTDIARSLDDEKLPRPVRLGALLDRLEAHWATVGGAETYRLGPYDFIPAESLLRGSGTDIRLTELERKLLACLVEASGAMVGRDQLLATVWGYSAGVDTHTVETHIWRLRQKIETDDPATRFLLTEAGGYRLVVGQRLPLAAPPEVW